MTTLSSSPVPVIYGIKNCDTIKKARNWLDERQIPYRFHDYRSDGLDSALLNHFIQQLGGGTLLNTRGTTGAAWMRPPAPKPLSQRRRHS